MRQGGAELCQIQDEVGLPTEAVLIYQQPNQSASLEWMTFSVP